MRFRGFQKHMTVALALGVDRGTPYSSMPALVGETGWPHFQQSWGALVSLHQAMAPGIPASEQNCSQAGNFNQPCATSVLGRLKRFLPPYQRYAVASLVNRPALSIRDAIFKGTRLAAQGACGKGARPVIVLRHGIGTLHFSNKRVCSMLDGKLTLQTRSS